MADEQETIAPVALDTPASAPEAITEPAIVYEPERIPGPEEVVGDDVQDGEPTVEQAAEEAEELEFGFKKYRVPKDLKEAVDAWRSSTTKKEQEVAERAKALEAQARQQVEASEAELSARAELFQVNKTLEEFSKLTQADWDAHYANDPTATDQARWRLQGLKDQKAELEGKISKAQSERTELAQSDLTKRIQETVEHAKKAIPGWKPDTIPRLVEFATEMGVPEDTIKQVWSPTFIDILHRAHIGHQLLQKQATAPKLPAPAPGAPLKTVNGKSTPAARGDLAAVDDVGAYIALRKQGVGGKASF